MCCCGKLLRAVPEKELMEIVGGRRDLSAF
jgi:hypothetical protein